MQALVTEAFGTQKKALASMGRSKSWLSRGLRARDAHDQTRMPGRDFVDRVLAACEVSDEVRERTRELYMEALASIDGARHAKYRAADRAAAAQDRSEEALQALEDFRARFARQAELHAREVARLEGEVERRGAETAADLAAAREREAEKAADLAAAQTRIGELTGQLAAERRGRRVDQATIEALREELVEAHTMIEGLSGELVEAHTMIEGLSGELAEARGASEGVREEPCRHGREEAVLAEAIVMTGQALTAERERAAFVNTAVPEEVAGRRRPAAGPVAVGSVAFVVMLLGGLMGLAVGMHPNVAADLDWAVVNELRGSTAAAGAALAAVIVGFSVWVGSVMALVGRGHLHGAGDRPYDSEPDFVVWI
jgi:hypothetical protein